MSCPFPGMDPYIERPAIFPDFHDRLITFVCSAIQPLLRPRYVALMQDRLYVVESERPIRPDFSIVRTTKKTPPTVASTAVAGLDAPAVFDLWREEIRQPLIYIIEPAAGNRLVTAIEILSPDNKLPGDGRASYIRKREEFWNSHTNLVEIDLLRDGMSTVRISLEKLASLQPWHYLCSVTRNFPSQQEVYAIPLQKRLPRIKIPLSAEDQDVPLDLQAVFTRCWDEGPYPEVLHYDGPPPGTMTAEEIDWCFQRLRDNGYRSA